MKKKIVLLVTAAMMLSLTACGSGGDDKPTVNTDKPADTAASTPMPPPDTTLPDTDSEEDEGGDSIVLFYGSNHYGGYEATFYCPEGAYIDEDDLEECEADGSVMSFTVYDDVRGYQAYAENHWSREIYTSDPEVYEVAPQLYFYGELDEINAEEYENCSQTVTDLGFQWEGKDVMLLETRYTMPGYPEYVELFACVEFENEYWRTKDGGQGGTEEHLFAPALVGFELSGREDLTVDQCAWIAGQLFGVDSGRTWALVEEETSIQEPAADVNAHELYGTWLERDSSWDNTYTFHEDGTGVLVSGPEYPFTYKVDGETLTLIYDEDDEESFTIAAGTDLLTLTDQFGNELILDRQENEVEASSDETEIPEVTEVSESTEEDHPYAKEILGTWVDNETEYKEMLTFEDDGTGLYSYYSEGTQEMAFTYTFINSDEIEIRYETGDSVTIWIQIDGDRMLLSNDVVYEMPFDRQQ